MFILDGERRKHERERGKDTYVRAMLHIYIYMFTVRQDAPPNPLQSPIRYVQLRAGGWAFESNFSLSFFSLFLSLSSFIIDLHPRTI